MWMQAEAWVGENRDDAPEDMAIGVYGMVHGLDAPCPGVVGDLSAGR
jgi:hypothetical protein